MPSASANENHVPLPVIECCQRQQIEQGCGVKGQHKQSPANAPQINALPCLKSAEPRRIRLCVVIHVLNDFVPRPIRSTNSTSKGTGLIKRASLPGPRVSDAPLAVVNHARSEARGPRKSHFAGTGFLLRCSQRKRPTRGFMQNESPAAGAVADEAALPMANDGTRISPGYVLFIMTLVYVVNYLDRQILGILGPQIKAEFHLTNTQLGLLGGPAFAVIYATLGIPIAVLAERVSRRNIIAVSMALFSVMTVVCGQAVLFWHLLLARFGTGIGEAGTGPSVNSIIADLYPPQRRAAASVLYSAGLNIGLLIAFFGGGMARRSIWLAHHDHGGGRSGARARACPFVHRQRTKTRRDRETARHKTRHRCFHVFAHLWRQRSFPMVLDRNGDERVRRLCRHHVRSCVPRPDASSPIAHGRACAVDFDRRVSGRWVRTSPACLPIFWRRKMFAGTCTCPLSQPSSACR